MMEYLCPLSEAPKTSLDFLLSKCTSVHCALTKLHYLLLVLILALKNIFNKIKQHKILVMPASQPTRARHYNIIQSNPIKRHKKTRKEKIAKIANKIKQQNKPDELANVQLAKTPATHKKTVLAKIEDESLLENTIVNTTGKSIDKVENSPSCLNCFGVEKHLKRCGGCWYVRIFLAMLLTNKCVQVGAVLLSCLPAGRLGQTQTILQEREEGEDGAGQLAGGRLETGTTQGTRIFHRRAQLSLTIKWVSTNLYL